MAIPLIVLDWMIIGNDGAYVKEGKCSVKSMSSILTPRKEYSEYRVGDVVEAKFKTNVYQAEIIAIGNQGNNYICIHYTVSVVIFVYRQLLLHS